MKTINMDEFFEKHHIKIIILFLILILISRIYKFGTLPIAIGVDEAGAAYDAFALANYGVDRYLNSYPIYLNNFGGGQSILYAYLNALLIKITGQDNLFISRLPELILFLLAIFISYKLVEKKQDKKTAIVFTFLIIVCPWLIEYSRCGLDCLLLGPMFMFDLYFLETAKKNWHYIIAGISIGITLYSYCLSWIIMPAFLIVWVIYRLYTRTVSIKNIITLTITVFIFAIPLFLFLLVNKGILNIEKIGIFTIPKIFQFRVGEISIYNLLLKGFKSINIILSLGSALYYFELPFLIIGIAEGIKDILTNSKKREYSFLTFMTLTFFTILISLLFVDMETTTRPNIMYIPLNYFIAIGTINVIKNSKLLFITFTITYMILFSIFEINYYTNTSLKEKTIYEDVYLTKAIEDLKNRELSEKDIYILTYKKAQPYIYLLLDKKYSPYEFNKNYEAYKVYIDDKNYALVIDRVYNYNFNKQEITTEYDPNKVYVVQRNYTRIIEFLEKIGYQKEELEYYYILN